MDGMDMGIEPYPELKYKKEQNDEKSRGLT